jgi:uncharacterized protein (DUF924 family)
MTNPKEILDFWFVETPEEKRFAVDPDLDDAIRDRFGALWGEAQEGKLGQWEESPEGALALVLLFDQFPRNMFRGTGAAFASDELAREVAKRAVARGFDMEVDKGRRWFFYMPYMHSEEFADQEESLKLFAKNGTDNENSYARRHYDAIRRFGRFPARNRVLGRMSTAEEIGYLQEHPSGF